MNEDTNPWAVMLLIGLLIMGLVVAAPSTPVVVDPNNPNPPVVVVPENQVTAVTFVYEKDLHFIPSPVSVALDKLNREKKILATTLEVDVKDGTGDIPEQYKPDVAVAQQVGMPLLVVKAGTKVLKTVKDPKTEQQVLESVQ